MFKQMYGAIFIAARTLGTVSELHIRIGQICFAADAAFMSVCCAGMHLGPFIRASAGFGTPSAVEFTLKAVLPVNLIRIKYFSLNIRQIENKAIESCSNNGIALCICTYQEHVDQINAIQYAEPFHLTGNNEIDPDDVIGEGHGKYNINGDVYKVCAESEPVIDGIGHLQDSYIVIAVNKADKTEIKKCGNYLKEYSAENELIVGNGSPGSFKYVSNRITAKQHQKSKKQTQNIISQHVRGNNNPGKEPPNLTVDDLIEIKNQVKKEVKLGDGYQISYRVTDDQPQRKVRYCILT